MFDGFVRAWFSSLWDLAPTGLDAESSLRAEDIIGLRNTFVEYHPKPLDPPPDSAPSASVLPTPPPAPPVTAVKLELEQHPKLRPPPMVKPLVKREPLVNVKRELRSPSKALTACRAGLVVQRDLW